MAALGLHLRALNWDICCRRVVALAKYGRNSPQPIPSFHWEGYQVAPNFLGYYLTRWDSLSFKACLWVQEICGAIRDLRRRFGWYSFRYSHGPRCDETNLEGDIRREIEAREDDMTFGEEFILVLRTVLTGHNWCAEPTYRFPRKTIEIFFPGFSEVAFPDREFTKGTLEKRIRALDREVEGEEEDLHYALLCLKMWERFYGVDH
jgi:hypothetical protein